MNEWNPAELIRRPAPAPRAPPQRTFYNNHERPSSSSPAEVQETIETELDPANPLNHLSFFATPEPLYIIHILPRPRPPPLSSSSSSSTTTTTTGEDRLLPLNVKIRLKTPFDKVFQAYTYKVNSSPTSSTSSSKDNRSVDAADPLTTDMLEFRLQTYQEPERGFLLNKNSNLGEFLVQAMDIVVADGRAKGVASQGKDAMLLVWVSIKQQETESGKIDAGPGRKQETTAQSKPVKNGKNKK
ncbi:hypothetical protein ACM66B_006345 [Microbotryomycetes sp. NB124-2]